ncbi:MAG: class I SAM-dependent methyltransferase [Betaproteobacteria bacterium]
MTTTPEFIGSTPWWRTASGRHLLAWERQWFDAGVADVFGFHALQMGLPAVDALQMNRMPHRWLACAAQALADDAEPGVPGQVRAVHLQCEFDALPFASQSLDLVVMPHALEMARDPHLTLREVERVLVPEGRLMITAFNPASLWALRPRQRRGGTVDGAGRPWGLWPQRAEMIGFRRLRDWLRLLSFEVEAARFGCFGPRVDTLAWQQRWSFVEPVGQRWWPVLGAVYGLTAVKRVRGMRLVGLAKRQARYASAPRPALVSTHQEPSRRGSPRS